LLQEQKMSRLNSILDILKTLLEIVSAGLGFALSFIFSQQLDLGEVPGFFIGLLGGIFAFITAQGVTSMVTRIFKRQNSSK
jgi:hypothetical protein